MEIILAKSAGFCFGVERAIRAVEEEFKKGKKIYTFGPLIHNPQFIQKLEEEGILAIEDTSKIKKGDTVIIRSHGTSKKVLEEIEKKGAKVADATCPFVKRAQLEAKKMEDKGFKVLIVGDENHPEVKGILGNLKGGIAIKGITDLKKIRKYEKVGIVSQTTFEREKFNKIVEKCLVLGNQVEVVDTICNATKEKQEETSKIAKNVDLLIVIGGKKSSNTKHLAQIGKKFTKTYHIEEPSELKVSWFSGAAKVGVTAGASTPEYIIKAVINKIESFA